MVGVGKRPGRHLAYAWIAIRAYGSRQGFRGNLLISVLVESPRRDATQVGISVVRQDARQQHRTLVGVALRGVLAKDVEQSALTCTHPHADPSLHADAHGLLNGVAERGLRLGV